MSWWWAVAAFVLVVAAGAVARCARRVEAERAGLVSALDRLEPLRVDAARLSGELARVAAAASTRRPRLAAGDQRQAGRGPERPAGGAEVQGTDRR